MRTVLCLRGYPVGNKYLSLFGVGVCGIVGMVRCGEIVECRGVSGSAVRFYWRRRFAL